MARALALVAALAQLRAADAAAAVHVGAAEPHLQYRNAKAKTQGQWIWRRGHGRAPQPPVRADDAQDGLKCRSSMALYQLT